MSGLLVAGLVFVEGEWASGSILLAVSAFFGSIVMEEMAPDKPHPERWGRVIWLTATLVMISVACVRTLEGDFVFAADCGLLIVILLVIHLGRRVQFRRAGNST